MALATAAPETPAEATASRRTSRTANVALNEHYNEPVRLHIWKSKRRTWTRGQLDRERREFFETRVTGHAEVWAAISTAIELMRAGDLVTAQSILDAAGITVPTGDLCQGCYDQQGALYRLPQCIVSDPTNMVQTDTSTATESQDAIEQDEDEEALSDGKLATDDASGDELISEDMERRRDEKGKTSERDLIRVRVRLSDRGGPDLVLMIGKGQSVGFLARKVRQEAEISSVQSVRIAYLGCMLKEQQSLPDQGWEPGHIVNAFVVPRRGFNE
ncbi:hypothetical protein N7532_011713 [Penicillium argentinense]|uniref:Ubiquitin-like domain-containing protein n=1 Tax=Penicillium argentinense TaxID=1131581 RepID=A0A9W9EJ46_9EURO|nr:uncharacterized protein N7532_011713 [Penicillium argentinense]KAJ5082670.1 hypothetical protein N7532_011713 [Penicillium argentinense]